LAFHKDVITQLKNGRVSFKKAYDEKKYQIIYDDASGMKHG
jgi:F0F1-type ATP synthase epsilon subunit